MNNVLPIIIVLLLSGCDMSALMPDADEKFGKQNFNSAVALIELHNTRTGDYPQNLAEIKYLGDWDMIWLNAVRYEKTDSGYNLYVERGLSSEPNLSYSIEFREGLGLQDSNISWVSE